MSITAKHSNVYYICRKDGFEPVEKATGCKNNHGLDLFKHDGSVYEGRSGAMFMTEIELHNLDIRLNSNGGVEKFNENINAFIAKHGESPRYTRPEERKQDVFPPDPEKEKDKENTVFVKGSDGKKHYYYRFHNENGIELFTEKSTKNFYKRAYVQCEGYMLDIGDKNGFEDVIKWLSNLENGIKGEVERVFNESMADPQKWANPFFAEILGRVDEAKAHNAPVREARKFANQQRDAERQAKRIAEEQAEKAAYEKAIKEAENNLMEKKEVKNSDTLDGKSLIMQLFREHDIAVPLKTQGWIISSLHSIYFNENKESWSYRYNGNPSTVFFDYLDKLLAAVQTKQQFEELNQNADDTPDYNSHIENEDENDIEI